MKKNNSKLTGSTGSLCFSTAVLIFVQCFLHTDFWNWGTQTLYFGWLPGSFLYRIFMIFAVTPAACSLIIKLCWPKNDEVEDK